MTAVILNIILAVLLAVAILLNVWARYVAPYMRLQRLRKEALRRMPMPSEVWMQDDEFLFIEYTDKNGVLMFTIDEKNKSVIRWRDSWEQWERRLRSRTVFYAGKTQGA